MGKVWWLFGLKLLATKLLKLILLFGLGCLIVLSFNRQPLLAKSDLTKGATSPHSDFEIVNRDRYSLRQISGRDLLQQGQQLYQRGQFSAAIRVWQQAVNIFAEADNTLDSSLALGYIATGWQQLGEWQQGQKAIATAWQLLKLKNDRHSLPIRARLFNIQGQLELAQNQESAALDSWQKAETIYRQLEDTEGIIGTQINQAKALERSGLYRQAQKIWEKTREAIVDRPNSLLKARLYNDLGKLYWYLGDLEKSQQLLESSLTVTKQLRKTDPELIFLELASLQSDISLNLGNTFRAKQEIQQALQHYQQGKAIAIEPTRKTLIQANQLSLLVEIKQWQQARSVWQEIKPLLATLPIARETIYARINTAESLIKIEQQNREKTNIAFNEEDIWQLLNEARVQSQKIEDTRSESTAIGVLAHWYELEQSWDEARQLTQKALTLAQKSQSPEIIYRWQWQLGRLEKARGETQKAIAFYEEAVTTLQLLRQDLIAIDPEIQFSFQERIEPVYRQLVELLLQHEPGVSISQQNLRQALQIIESLQVAKLENFFHEVCLTVKSTNIDNLDSQTAVIYPIILSQKLAIILSLPQQPLRYYETAISSSASEELFFQMRQSLRRTSFEEERLPIAERVYDLLIRPEEARLIESKVTNLTFVLDGILKNIPMSALYDGEEYLIEKYSIALAPSIQLLETRSVKSGHLKGLIGALSEARQGFSPLPGVIQEIEQISSQIPTKILLNREFTRHSIHTKVEDSSLPVLHLATHGQFSSEVEKTFILAWDDKINVRELAQWLQLRGYDVDNPIELLVLSACETAAGDRNAALGMAGVAVRSGVRSTVASLWSVQDDSTAILMTEFYQELSQRKSSKAEALRRAQLVLLKQPESRHPFYWASFVLIGNWL